MATNPNPSSNPISPTSPTSANPSRAVRNESSSVQENEKLKYRFLLPLISTLDIGISTLISYLIISNLNKSIDSIISTSSNPKPSILSSFFQKINFNNLASHNTQPTLTNSNSNPFFIDYLTSTFNFASNGKDDKVLELSKLTWSILACAIVKCSTLLIVSISKNIRNLGILVGAVCMLSTLFNVSIANLLFQGRSFIYPSLESITKSKLQDLLLHPTLPIFLSFQLFFTLLEWLIYVAIVSERNQRRSRSSMSTAARRKRTLSGISTKSNRTANGLGRSVSRNSVAGDGVNGVNANGTGVFDNQGQEDEFLAEGDLEHQHDQAAEDGEGLNEDEDTENSQDDDDDDDEEEEDEELDEISRNLTNNQPLSTSPVANETTSLLKDPITSTTLPITPYRNSFNGSNIRPKSQSFSPSQQHFSSTSNPTSTLASQDDEDDEEEDPNEIIDITPNKKLSRKESKKRLKRSMSTRIDKLKGRFGFRTPSGGGNASASASINEADENVLEEGQRSLKGKNKGKGKDRGEGGYGTFSS